MDKEDISKELTPKGDWVFKRLFGSKGNEEILKDFLEYVLETKIRNVNTDLATEFIPELKEGKTSRVDVRAELSDGTQVDVEMQKEDDRFSDQRCLYYWSRIYANGIKKKKSYKELKKVICIWIVDETVYKELKEFKTHWVMQEEKSGDKNHFKEVEIYVIELKKFRATAIMEQKKKDFWLWFLDYTNREMIEMACINNERIREARKQLDEITSDPALMEAILNEEMSEMDEKMAIERKTERAMKEGEKKKQFEIAKKLKENGIHIDIISQSTGLTIEEIEKL